MEKLTELRGVIQDLDWQMQGLFLERLKLVREVGLLKKSMQIEVEDLEQERRKIRSLLHGIDDHQDAELYQDFLQYVMDIAKKEQRRLADLGPMELK